MEKEVNLNMSDIQDISNTYLKNINGGTTNPTYDIKDNYDGLISSWETAGPILIEVGKAFAKEIVRFFAFL